MNKPAAARLHHNAYVVKDQEATRKFYEDVLGFPLAACWTEKDEILGAERVYCHTFYALEDGSALAFFQFANPKDYEEFRAAAKPKLFWHIALKTDAATQDAIKQRLKDAKWEHFELDHGYCKSLYASDPDGMNVELTVDHADAAKIDAIRRKSAHEDLARWLGGDHRSNNMFRPE